MMNSNAIARPGTAAPGVSGTNAHRAHASASV